MAPILSFTMEEAWAVFASKEEFEKSDETLFTLTAYSLPEIKDEKALLDKYGKLKAIRADVMKELEEVRISGKIGSSLQAEIEIRASGDKYSLLKSLDDDLKFLMITSKADVVEVADEKDESISWHYRGDVGADSKHPHLCARCAANLFGEGEDREFV